jgi:hypothetical protein
MRDMNSIVGQCDILFITLDTLRYDVAVRALEMGKTATIAQWLPPTGWECRHTPGNFTYAAHHAFFAGFLPTPLVPGPHPRLFASKFEGSETTTPRTFQFNEDNWIAALARLSYRTICIGGVGFFNKQSALGNVLPSFFQESYWSPDLGVTCPESTENQVALACSLLRQTSPVQRVCLFINISAIHQPNYFYLEGATQDSLDSQLAALGYVDRSLAPLFSALQTRGPTFCILSSDHGTAYGESGYHGHRLNHAVVGNVPYIDFVLPPAPIASDLNPTSKYS